MEQKGAQAHRQQPERVAHRLPSGAMTLWINNGQHLEARLSVFVAVNPGNCQEMRQLPERQNRKQRPTARRAAAGFAWGAFWRRIPARVTNGAQKPPPPPTPCPAACAASASNPPAPETRYKTQPASSATPETSAAP